MFNKIFAQEHNIPSTNPIKFALEACRFNKKLFFGSLVLLILSVIAANLVPLATKGFFDNVELLKFDQIYFYAILGFGLTFLAEILDYFYGIYATILYGNIGQQARTDAIEYTNKHSDDYFSSRQSGLISSAIMSTRNISGLLFMHIEETMPALLTLIVSAILALTVDWRIGLAIIIFESIVAYFALKQTNTIGRIVKRHQEIKHKSWGFIGDVVANVKITKIFNVGKLHLQKVFQIMTKHTRSAKSMWIAKAKLTILLDFSDVASRLVSAVVLSYLYWIGVISLGDFSMIFFLLGKIEESIFNLINMVERYQTTRQEIAVALEKIIVPITNTDSPNAQKLKLKKLPSIEFKNLSFNYNNGPNKQLKNINLQIRPGEKIGIVGASGAGKSTLFKLILKQYPAPNGTIFINQQDIAEHTKDSVRANIAVVSQDTLVFNRSLEQNITLGKKYTKAQIQQALKDSHCDQFIKDLPDGIQTKVGERGVKLSGGQKQRVGIARALLKNSPIVLLDEATSALDSKSEKFIQDSLQKLAHNHTMLVIAHRLSTLNFMDRIIVMDKGQIKEVGTHKELLAKKGIYYKLWQHQTGGCI